QMPSPQVRRPTTRLRTRRALLILDCQNAFLNETVGNSPNPMALPPSKVSSVIANLTPLVTAFRAAGDEVIWVNTEFIERRESRQRDGVFSDDVKGLGTSGPKGKKALKDLISDILEHVESDAEGTKLKKEDGEVVIGSKSDDYLSANFLNR